ncbi:hydrophobic surface binding protein A domain-containing protein [Trichoderma sp. SZMC 28014]
MKFQLVSLLALLPSALAQTDANPILTALGTITSDTTSLNTTVANFDGDPLNLIKITIQSAQLLSDINKGTDTANNAANLTLDQTLAIATATLALATDVNQTITTIINTKPEFDKLLVVDPVILLNLKLEQDATRKFSAAVVSKVPAALQSVAQGLTQGIDDSFSEGIAVYEQFL